MRRSVNNLLQASSLMLQNTQKQETNHAYILQTTPRECFCRLSLKTASRDQVEVRRLADMAWLGSSEPRERCWAAQHLLNMGLLL